MFNIVLDDNDGRYHILSPHGSDYGSYGRRADAVRGMDRLIARQER